MDAGAGDPDRRAHFAAHGAATQRLVLPGTVQAWYEAPIYARVSGYLKDWYFDYGAHVKKGDVLAEIETPDLDAQLAGGASQAQFGASGGQGQGGRKAVRRDRPTNAGETRQRALSRCRSRKASRPTTTAPSPGSTPRIAEVAADQGDVDRLQALEDFKRITAPFDGVVTARETDIGALINAGSGTGAATDPSYFGSPTFTRCAFTCRCRSNCRPAFKPGSPPKLHLPQYPDKTFKATVATTSSAINTSARTLLVELHADNPDGLLQPGAYAQVDFELPSNPNVVRIPTSALVFRERGMEVAIIGPDDKIELKPITLGRNLGTEVEVLKGLNVVGPGGRTARRIRLRPATRCTSPASRPAAQAKSRHGADVAAAPEAKPH